MKKMPINKTPEFRRLPPVKRFLRMAGVGGIVGVIAAVAFSVVVCASIFHNLSNHGKNVHRKNADYRKISSILAKTEAPASRPLTSEDVLPAKTTSTANASPVQDAPSRLSQIFANGADTLKITSRKTDEAKMLVRPQVDQNSYYEEGAESLK